MERISGSLVGLKETHLKYREALAAVTAVTSLAQVQ